VGFNSMIGRSKAREAFAVMSAEHIDPDALVKDWTDDVVWVSASELGPGELIRGKKAIVDWFKRWEEEFPQRKLVPKNVCMKSTAWPSRNNVMMCDWTCTETDKSGRQYRYEGVSVLRMEKGKIVQMADYISFAGLPQLSSLLQPSSTAP
jgi:ketosteroid isomerase-like protein